MPITKVARRSFAGGEITPEMFGRTDNVKNQTGLALCRNALVLPHGPVTKRPGTAFVNIASAAISAVRLIPFVFSATQSMLLEFGNGYIRFHTAGATLLEASKACAVAGSTVNCTAHGYNTGDWVFIGGAYYRLTVTGANSFTVVDTITGTAALPAGTTCARVYTLASPYAASDLSVLKYTQDADVLTISHPGYPTYELRRLSATSWTLSAPTLGASIAQPNAGGAATVTATVGTGTAYPKDHFYRVTAVTSDGLQESLSTSAAGTTVDLTLPGSKNTVSWTAPAGLTNPTYRVYKADNTSVGLFGYIGETSGLSFIDDNIIPDYSRNPPSAVMRLDTAGNYPGAVSYFEQRRVFAGSTNDPQAVQMTRTGTESNLSTSNPSQSGDAIAFRLKAQQQNAIRHLLPLSDLLALTASAVWRIFSNTDGPLLPSTVAARVQAFDGASHVTPVLTGTGVLFVENNGKRVRDIAYSTEARSYVTNDRTVLAPHLFNDYTLVDAAFQRTPDKVAWFARSDGALLSLTFLPEQQVYAWAQHVTDGTVESVCVVPESNQDVLYLLVRRTLRGVTTRVIERMAPRQFATLADAFFVDCGATYSGAPTLTLSNLWHLEGKTVAVLADGGVLSDLVVTGGTLTLPLQASTVQVGLPYATDVQTVPMSVDAAAASGSGTVKALGDTSLLVYRTGVFSVGPDEDSLTEYPMRTNEAYDSAPTLKSEELSLEILPEWDRAGQLWIRSADPVPLTLSALTTQVHLAG
jgi:hypothetical protein